MSGAVSGISGASPIWNRIIKFALDKIEDGEIPGLGESSEKHAHLWPRQPDDVVGATICTISGSAPSATPSATQPAPESGCPTRFEYFLEGTTPKDTEALRRQIAIDKTTGQLATEKTPPENIELQEHSVLFDILGTPFCLDCAFPTEAILINPATLPKPTAVPE